MILTTSIAALIAPCTVAMPRPAYGDETDDPGKPVGLEERVVGEEPPDFSFLDSAGGGDDAAPASQDGKEGASGAPDGAPQPPDGQTGAGEAIKEAKPDAGTPAADPNDDKPVPPVKPEAPASEKPPEKKAEPAVKAEEKPPAEIKLPTDEEIEAMQPKPGAPAKVIADFKAMKDGVVKPALAEVKRLKAELEQVKKEPKLSPDVEAKLKQAEEDRQWREAFDAENDPRLQEQFKTKIEKVEGDLFKMLQEHPRLKMNPAAVEKLKEFGLDSPQGRAATQKILDAVKKLNNDLLLDEVKDAFKARDGAVRERQRTIEDLRAKQGELGKMREDREKEERQSWSKALDQQFIEHVKVDSELFFLKDASKAANYAEKAAIEAHNKHLQEVVVPEMQDRIRAMYSRDPAKTSKMIVDSMRLEPAMKKVETLQKQLDDAKARIAELEGDGARVRRVSSPSRADGAGSDKKSASKEGVPFDVSAEDAVDAYRREHGLLK